MTIDRAITEISSFLGDRLTRSKSELSQHGHSESYFQNMPPDAVAYPRSTEDVAEIVRICAANSCPVVAWGTGTSLEGHALAPRGGVSVDFRLMNQVLAVHPEDMDVVVQPGLTREALNTELRATGLFFPVDPGANASLGGMAATRASGTTTVRYGSMRENVIGLEVVLADGEVIRTGTRAVKSASGYDLTKLFVGSEGTLGLITELTLRLKGQPEAVSAAVCPFNAFQGAVATVIETIQMGIPMARIEFVDAEVAQMFNTHNAAGLPEAPHLLVEFHGSESGVAESVERFGEIAAANGGGAMRWARKAEERLALWKMRHDLAHTIMASYPGKRFIFTDVCVPISRLAEAVAETRDDIEQSGMAGPMAGHVGDGNFHAALVVDPDRPEDMKLGKALAHRMVERALRMGGTVTGEHGVGMGKLDYMEQEHGPAWKLMARIKQALDPDDIMNPGKVVRQNG
jgi:D-lactate dehydrogenase (cytochrome)